MRHKFDPDRTSTWKYHTTIDFKSRKHISTKYSYKKDIDIWCDTIIQESSRWADPAAAQGQKPEQNIKPTRPLTSKHMKENSDKAMHVFEHLV